METSNAKSGKKGIWISVGCIVLVIILILLLMTRCDGEKPVTAEGTDLAQLLAQPGDLVITLDEDIVIDGPLTVCGNKTIAGTGSVVLNTELEGPWPDTDIPSWGMGCVKLEAENAADMPAMIRVDKGASLTLGGTVTIDAGGNGNGILLGDKSTLTLSESAVVKNGRYANLVVNETASASLAGGQLLDGAAYNVINYGAVDLTGTNIYNNGGEITVTNLTVDTAAKNAVQHKSGTTSIDGVVAQNLGNHGAYVEQGTLTVQNGTFTAMAANGFYLPAGDSKLILENVTISDAVQQGINNASVVEAKNVTIINTDMNGIYNKAGGQVTIDGLTVSDTGEHGINNKAVMTASNVTVKNTGADSNGIQNNGTLTLRKVSVTNSKNHGIYNDAALTGSDITINSTVNNGVYNDGGNASITGLTVSNTSGQGVNNNAAMVLQDVKVTAAGKNGVYNSGGTAEITNLTVSGTGEHGISNEAEMTAANVTVENTGAEKNGIQNSGTLTLTACNITGSGNHGIYNSGRLSGSDISIAGADNNGVYNDKGTVNAIQGLTVTDVAGQGVNNTGTFTALQVSVSATGKNGIYTNGGTTTITGLTVTDPGEHGVSNDNAGVVVITDAVLTGSGKGSNCVQNKADMTLVNVTAADSSNHGIYNDSVLKAQGKLTVTGAAVNGIYNYGGQATLETAVISGCGQHGVNNTGTLTGQTITIDGAVSNGIQNNGTMTVTGSAAITDSGNHGIYNGKRFEGTNITVENAYDLLVSNAGDMVIRGLNISGTAHKALYNNGYAELYTVTVMGDEVTNGGSAEYLVDNNGGVLDLTDATLLNAKGTAVESRGKAATNVTNVIVDHVGNFGFFVESGSVLSGDGLVVNNVTKNTAVVSSAEGIAIKTAGKVTMMDHVTLGAYDDAVTGSGIAIDKSVSGLVSTALQVDADSASYSGYDLVIKNAPSGNGIYNKGTVYVTDLSIDNCNYGIANRYNGWTTLSGTVEIRNIAVNPVRNFGLDDGSQYQNGLALTSGADMTIDTAGSHGINNKGSFLAAADSTLTIRGIRGQNVNAINNNTGTMTLGDVMVDGVYVTISQTGTGAINTNSGNGIQTSGSLELNGRAVICNLFYLAEGGMTDNSNGSGVVVKSGGTITGAGSITVIGDQTAPAGFEGYAGLYNGILLDGCTLTLTGDITVTGTANQGVYAANANAAVQAANIIVQNAGGNGIYVNNATGSVTASGAIQVSGSGQHGINNVGTVKAASIAITNAGTNGINNNGGTLTVTGEIAVDQAAGHGIGNSGTISAGTVSVSNVPNNIGINNSGTVEADSITVTNVGANGSYNGINNTGTLTVTDEITVDQVTNYGISNSAGKIQAETVEVSQTTSIGIFLEKSASLTATRVTVRDTGSQAIQLNHVNTLTVNTLIVRNSANNGLRIYNTSGQPTITIGTMVADNCKEYGLTAQAAITSTNLKVTTLYWQDCTKGGKHGNVAAGCVGTILNTLPSAEVLTSAEETGN